MHSDSLKQLGESFQAEVQPMVVEVEGRTLQLKGTAEEQYHEWRRLLKELYENETGTPVQTPAAAEPAAARARPEAAAGKRTRFLSTRHIASCWRAGRNCLRDSFSSDVWGQAAAAKSGLRRTASAAASSRSRSCATIDAGRRGDRRPATRMRARCGARPSEYSASRGLYRSAQHTLDRDGIRCGRRSVAAARSQLCRDPARDDAGRGGARARASRRHRPSGREAVQRAAESGWRAAARGFRHGSRDATQPAAKRAGARRTA